VGVRDEAGCDGAARWRDYSVNCLMHRRAAGVGSMRELSRAASAQRRGYRSA
jgi:hypothetical protein